MNAIERIRKLEARIAELENALFDIYQYPTNTPHGILNIVHSVLTKRTLSQRVANMPNRQKPSSAGYAP